MKIDVEGIMKMIVEKHKKFIEDPSMSPAEFESLADKHISGKCDGACWFCEVDRSALSVNRDKAAGSVKN